MFNLNLKIAEISQIKRIALVLSLVILISLPALSLSSKRNDLYVDDSNHGSEDGSKSHPYNTINEAMEKAKKNKTDIHVAKGFYKENIEIKDGVRIFGEDKNDVVIEGKSGKKPTIFMNDETVIDKVTIKKGKYGIKVQDDAKVSIVKCVIKDSNSDGIYVNAGEVRDSRKVSISKSTIKDSDGAGIFSGKRSLSITESEIYDNDGDGIDLAAGSSAWIYKNTITDNDKSGMKLRIDQSNIWTKKNKIAHNGREGIEVNFYGGVGRIDILDSAIFQNGKYGVARVQRIIFGNSIGLWSKYLTFSGVNNIGENKAGNISGIFIITQ